MAELTEEEKRSWVYHFVENLSDLMNVQRWEEDDYVPLLEEAGFIDYAMAHTRWSTGTTRYPQTAKDYIEGSERTAVQWRQLVDLLARAERGANKIRQEDSYRYPDDISCEIEGYQCQLRRDHLQRDWVLYITVDPSHGFFKKDMKHAEDVLSARLGYSVSTVDGERDLRVKLFDNFGTIIRYPVTRRKALHLAQTAVTFLKTLEEPR